MSFLAPQISSRLANPGLFEQQIKNYFRASNNIVQQDKTIADRIIYDAKNVDALDSVQFFTGTYNQNLTNLEGSYVRPASEHVIIYGIAFYTDNGTSKANVEAGSAVWQEGFTTGNNPIATGDINSEVPAPHLDVSLTCNGVVYLNDVWGMDWDSDLATYSRGKLLLNNPIVWPGQTQLTVEVVLGEDGTKFPTNYSIKCELISVGLI